MGRKQYSYTLISDGYTLTFQNQNGNTFFWDAGAFRPLPIYHLPKQELLDVKVEFEKENQSRYPSAIFIEDQVYQNVR